MATRGNQINPIVEWDRPSDPQKPWGPQAEDSQVMRHRFDKKEDATHEFKPDSDYIMTQQQWQTINGIRRLGTVTFIVKGRDIVDPNADGFITPYTRDNFGYIVAYYEALP